MAKRDFCGRRPPSPIRRQARHSRSACHWLWAKGFSFPSGRGGPQSAPGTQEPRSGALCLRSSPLRVVPCVLGSLFTPAAPVFLQFEQWQNGDGILGIRTIGGFFRGSVFFSFSFRSWSHCLCVFIYLPRQLLLLTLFVNQLIIQNHDFLWGASVCIEHGVVYRHLSAVVTKWSGHLSDPVPEEPFLPANGLF